MKYVVTVNGERYEVEVERADGRSSGSLSRRPAERAARTVEAASAPVAAAPTPAAAPVAAPASSGEAKAVICPMPGTILDVKVKEGDVVEYGQAVIILEAMKMENEITTEFAGTVASVKVKKGDTVDTDAVLVEIK